MYSVLISYLHLPEGTELLNSPGLQPGETVLSNTFLDFSPNGFPFPAKAGLLFILPIPSHALLHFHFGL